MGGCENCQCGAGNDPTPDTCATDVKKVVLDKSGKCPCGKVAEECCHNEELKENSKDVEKTAK